MSFVKPFFIYCAYDIICRFFHTLLNNPSPFFPQSAPQRPHTPLERTTKYLKGNFFSHCPPPPKKTHNFISHNSSIPQLPNQKYRYNSSRRITKRILLRRNLKIQGGDNKLGAAGLFSTAASETYKSSSNAITGCGDGSGGCLNSTRRNRRVLARATGAPRE